MDIRLEGPHEEMLLALAQLNHEPTATGMVRLLVRDAAMRAGLWSAPGRVTDVSAQGDERDQETGNVTETVA